MRLYTQKLLRRLKNNSHCQLEGKVMFRSMARRPRRCSESLGQAGGLSLVTLQVGLEGRDGLRKSMTLR